MSKPGEHKTVQARIVAYAEAIGWTFVSRAEAEIPVVAQWPFMRHKNCFSGAIALCAPS